MPDDPPAEFLSPAQIGQRWGVSARHVRRLMADGRLPYVRLGPNTIRARLGDVEAFEAAVEAA